MSRKSNHRIDEASKTEGKTFSEVILDIFITGIADFVSSVGQAASKEASKQIKKYIK